MSVRVHLQNEYADRVEYWQRRGELPDHVFRKAWQWRRYDGRVEVGDPLPTKHYTREELVEAGIVGLWGYRMENGMDETREQLAALAHEQWCGWMEYLFRQGTTHDDGSFTIAPWAVERWLRQMGTPYAELPEEERVSDRAEADRVLAVLSRQGKVE